MKVSTDYHRTGYLAALEKLTASNEAKKEQRLERSAQFKKPCRACGAEIPYNKRRNDFCNHTCAQRYNNRARGLKSTDPTRKCQGCQAPRPNGANKFCDECIANGKSNHYNRLGFDDLRTDQARRKRLIAELGRICQICGLTAWAGKPAPVVLDHIDGHSDRNTRANCRLVCPNCDAQLPTFSGRNRGNGRLARRLARQRQKKLTDG